MIKSFVFLLLPFAFQVAMGQSPSSHSNIQTSEVKVKGMVFNVRTAGNPSDQPVILLHGFPETSAMWESLMENLAAQGYFCVAPDQRGYSPGARPRKVKGYEISLLAEDVVNLTDHYGMGRFHLIGHDWGSAVGWAVVRDYPGRIQSWTALSVPHLQSFGDAILHDPAQQKMSGYIKTFQLRGLPEAYLKKGDFKALRSIWSASDPDQVDQYLSVFRQKGALRSALNYYRANYKTLKGKGRLAYGEVKTPTLIIWGNKDMAIGRAAVEGTEKWMKGFYSLEEMKAGHWLIQEELEQVSSKITAHLARNKP